MPPTGVASAAWVAAASTSRTPFYAAGAALVAWAVLVAAVGITHPGFPGSAALGRLVMLVSIVLVATTITTAVVTGSGPAKPAVAASTSHTVRIAADPSGQLAYQPASASAAAGKVTIDFTNRSPVDHNVTIEAGGKAIAATKTIKGAATSVAATLPAGGYVLFCSVDAHRQGGMVAKLSVS
jgi:plastocyanin